MVWKQNWWVKCIDPAKSWSLINNKLRLLQQWLWVWSCRFEKWSLTFNPSSPPTTSYTPWFLSSLLFEETVRHHWPRHSTHYERSEQPLAGEDNASSNEHVRLLAAAISFPCQASLSAHYSRHRSFLSNVLARAAWNLKVKQSNVARCKIK